MAHREDIQPNVDKARANRHPFLKSWIETSKPLLFNSKPTGDPFTPPHVVTESPSSLQLYGLRAHSSPILPLTYAIATARILSVRSANKCQVCASGMKHA
nr:hypothetical protein Iba_chr13aCG10950 [Ipomoea batatas]